MREVRTALDRREVGQFTGGDQAPKQALAGEARFALIVGNNTGGRYEKDLRYSEDDARKVRDVLKA